MFCNGECIKKDKKGREIARCGLLLKVTHNLTQMTGSMKQEQLEQCAHIAHLIELSRINQAIVRLQAATEHSRNQEALDYNRIVETLAQGFTAMIYIGSKEGRTGEMLNRLGKTIAATQNKIKEIAEKQKEISSGKVSTLEELKGEPDKNLLQ